MDAALVAGMIAALLVFTWMTQIAVARRCNARLNALKAARHHLDRHLDCLDKLQEDPATPIALLTIATDMSEVFADERFGQSIRITAVAEPPPNIIAAEDGEWLTLQRTRPDLARTFVQCLASGVAAAVLRSSEVWDRYPEAIAALTSDPVRQARRVVKEARDQGKHGGGVGMGGHPTVALPC